MEMKKFEEVHMHSANVLLHYLCPHFILHALLVIGATTSSSHCYSCQNRITISEFLLIWNRYPTTKDLRVFFLSAMLGYLRGLRPRSDQRVSYIFAVALGVSSGWYIFHDQYAEDVAAHHARNATIAATAAAAKPK